MIFSKKTPPPAPEASAAVSGARPTESTNATIESITKTCLQAAAGDLEARIVGMNDCPQYGAMARAINSMLDMADSFVRETAAATSCFSLEEFHRPILLRGLRGAYRDSSVVINKAGTTMESSSESLKLVGDLAAENNLAISTVASACEELHATGNQISEQTRNAQRLSEESLHQGQEALKKMEVLEFTFKKIESIVSQILSISNKTNLLALNAAIEATRAGQHGARFGIIAQEVKELSKNTGLATEGISKQIELLRISMEDVGTGIHTIYQSLDITKASSAEIARSISEQVSATDEISRQIMELTTNSQKVADQIGHHH